MSSNSRMTRSKGPTEELSLPPTRMRKDVSTANEGEENAQGQVQANAQSQQRTVDMPSPFARPRSRAGTCITPASEGGMLPKASNPFARPDSRAGFAPPEPTSPQSSVSSTSDNQLQEDVTTSVSWDLVYTDTDAEVANINSSLGHRTVTDQKFTDSINTRQNNAVDLNNEINTLYNQDFFVADTTGRRLSQVTDKSNYLSLLPNENAALQLRLPDLLIYLKTDTYLVDVKTGHHYAVYHNRIEKMSVLLKLYSAWPYRQLLQAIHDDAVRFGVNSPEPATSEQSAPVAQPSSPVDREVQAAKKQQPSPCMPTIVNYEPPSFNLQIPKRMFTRSERDQVLRNHMTAANTTFNKVAVLEDLMWQEPHNAAHYKEVQRIQKNQHIQVAVKLQHMLEADNEFRQTAGLPQLDLPEHLWMVRNMDTAPVREQHSIAISSEVDVLHQQLKGKGVYPAPPNYMQINQQNVHFQPIQPAKLSPLQPQDRLFFNPLLSTTTGSTGSQSDSAHDPTQDCNSTHPKVHTPSPPIPEPIIPQTPYVNQAAVEQHRKTQSPSVPPRNIATVAPPPRESQQVSFAQETLITLATSQITPPQAQDQLTTSPQRPRKSKSKDGRGIKQSKNVNPTDTAQVCWRCGEPGHKCRKEGHVPALSGTNIILPDADLQEPFTQILTSPLTNDQLQALQAQDEKCTSLTAMLRRGKLDPLVYSMNDGVLHRRVIEGGQTFQAIYVPRTPPGLIESILTAAHDDSGHNGYSAIRQLYYWKGIKEDVRQHCTNCYTCQLHRTAAVKFEAKHFKPGMRPMDFIAMDLIGEFHPPSSQGNRYALTGICMLT